MRYFVFTSDTSNKFWEIEYNQKTVPSKVTVRYGKVGSSGITKDFDYPDNVLGQKFMEKKIQEKLKKGYVEVTSTKIASKKVDKSVVSKRIKSKRPNNIVYMVSDYMYPQQKNIQKTPNGFKYLDPTSKIVCTFKGTEPSPKGLGLCARFVNENEGAYGTDGNVWIKKGVRWVKKSDSPRAQPMNPYQDYTKNYYGLYPDESGYPNKKVHEDIYKTIVNCKGNAQKVFDILKKHRKDGADDTSSREAVGAHFQKLYKKRLDNNVVKASKKCPPGKVFNPNTGKCIKDKYGFLAYLMAPNNDSTPTPISPVNKKVVKPTKKKVKLVVKKCPPGKVLNPDTGRCINKPNKTKPAKSTKKKVKLVIKKCPVGKVLNPDTGRCINKPNKTAKKYSNPANPAKSVKPAKSANLAKPAKSAKSAKSANLANLAKLTKKKVKLVIKPKTKKVLWDVKTDGIMLAHTYKDPKTGKIKNPPKGFPKAPEGWFMSEKFDGYRAIWDGQNFRSRTGNIFVAPESFKKWLPNNVVLDGELFMGRECFEKCGIFRRKIPDESEWKKNNVQYRIFDVPNIKAPFEKRMDELGKIVKAQCKLNSGKCPLVLTQQIKVKSENHLYKTFDTLTKKGAEGVMIRAPGSPYVPKRSSHLLKVKQLFDDECIVVGYKMGTGKYNNMLGAFNCELKKNRKIKFDISGMDDSVRMNYKKTHPIGTEVTFTYMGLSSKNIPRHPNYLRKRK